MTRPLPPYEPSEERAVALARALVRSGTSSAQHAAADAQLLLAEIQWQRDNNGNGSYAVALFPLLDAPLSADNAQAGEQSSPTRRCQSKR